MATNWVDEVLSGATSTGSKTLSLATGNVLSVANSSSESLFTVTSDTTNGGYTSILGIEGQEAVLFLGADNSDDAGDVWELHSDTSGNFKIGNRTSGTGSPTRDNTFTNALSIDSSLNITVGVLKVGVDTETQGKVIMKRKDADEFPYIEMVSADGTSSFLFVANNGTLRIHSAAPTANTDGSAV